MALPNPHAPAVLDQVVAHRLVALLPEQDRQQIKAIRPGLGGERLPGQGGASRQHVHQADQFVRSAGLIVPGQRTINGTRVPPS